MATKEYELDYHRFFHNKLLNNKKYYIFRAMYADKAYWKHFENTDKGKFLEFGCGIGQNIFLHRKNAEGIDISEFCIRKCKSYGINASNSIEMIKDNSLDGVLCCHVLEHLENPIDYLRHFLRLLKPKGRLVLVLPVQRIGMAIKPDYKSGHLYAWTVPIIWELLERAGFKVKSGKFSYAAGFSLFYGLPVIIAMALIRALGYMRDQKEMILVAEK